jgi:hypothetical protein
MLQRLYMYCPKRSHEICIIQIALAVAYCLSARSCPSCSTCTKMIVMGYNQHSPMFPPGCGLPPASNTFLSHQQHAVCRAPLCERPAGPGQELLSANCCTPLTRSAVCSIIPRRQSMFAFTETGQASTVNRHQLDARIQQYLSRSSRLSEHHF